jgi:hypothetical protein
MSKFQFNGIQYVRNFSSWFGVLHLIHTTISRVRDFGITIVSYGTIGQFKRDKISRDLYIRRVFYKRSYRINGSLRL